jgi:transcriptional regulator with XRE-family HTH domain
MPRGRPSKEPRTNFGQRLQAAREAAGFSQAEVAAQLGIKQSAYAAWERYPVAILPIQIERAARMLKVPVGDLFEKAPRAFRKNGPTGRARRAFEALKQISHQRQKTVLIYVEAVLANSTRRRKNRFVLPESNPFSSQSNSTERNG